MGESANAPPDDERSARLRRWAGIGVSAFAFLLFVRAVDFGFVRFDDPFLLLARPHLYDETSLWRSIAQIFVHDLPRAGPLPLRDLSWAIDARLFGFENPYGYHLGNVVLHALNVGLVYSVGLLLRLHWSRAALVAATFAALPLHVEAVCWVMGRKDVLVSFFMLLAVRTHLVGLLGEQQKALLSPRGRTAAILGLCLFALMAKVNALSLFGVLLVLDAAHGWLTGDEAPDSGLDWRQVVRRVVPRYAPHLVLSVLFFVWFRAMSAGADTPPTALAEHARGLVSFTPWVGALYLEHIFVPWGHSILYPWPTLHDAGLSVVGWVGWAVIVLAALVGSIWMMRRRRDLAAVAVIVVGLLVPYLNLVYTGIWLADRYAYLAAAFVLFGLALVDKQQSRPPPKWATAGALLYIAVCAAATWSTQTAFRTDIELWEYEVAVPEPSLMAYASYADALKDEAAMVDGQHEPERRAELLALARRAIEDGKARHEQGGFLDTEPHYHKLFLVEGFVAEVEGRPLVEVAESYERARVLRPHAPVVLSKVAEVRYKLALTAPTEAQKRELATSSLEVFAEYLRRAPPVDPAGFVGLLENGYAREFPFLRERAFAVSAALKAGR